MSVLWGGSYLLIEIAERGGIPALWVAWLRICVGAAVLVLVAARAGTLTTVRRAGRWRWLLAYAVAELAIPWPLISLGETHVASSVTAIIIASVPLFTALLALRFDQEERPTPIRAVGLGLGFAGVVALVGLDLSGSSGELLGAGAIFVASFCYAIGALIVKHGLAGLDPRATMATCLTLAAIGLSPVAAFGPAPHRATAGAVIAVLALGLVCTAAALVIFSVLIREAGPGRATVITYVNPVVALALGVGLEGELGGSGLVQAVGGLLLILAGSWLATAGGIPRALRRRPGAAR